MRNTSQNWPFFSNEFVDLFGFRREREAKEGREKGAQRTGNDEDKSSDPTPTTIAECPASIDTHTQVGSFVED